MKAAEPEEVGPNNEGIPHPSQEFGLSCEREINATKHWR